MNNLENRIRSAWEDLNSEVDSISSEFGKPRPLIIAVSKTRPIEEIQAAYDIGIRDFGENYAQELEEKAKILPNATWHYIGHLQRSNVKRVMPHADYLHTLDSNRLADKITNFGFEGKSLIQIKISDDLSKHGLINNYSEITQLNAHATQIGLKVIGLMAIGGLTWDENRLRTEYAELYKLNQDLGFDELSIGMSGDYRIAIECGSSMLRIGTRIFGERQK